MLDINHAVIQQIISTCGVSNHKLHLASKQLADALPPRETDDNNDLRSVMYVARNLMRQYVESPRELRIEFVLLAIILEEDSEVSKMLQSFGLSEDNIRSQIEHIHPSKKLAAACV